MSSALALPKEPQNAYLIKHDHTTQTALTKPIGN